MSNKKTQGHFGSRAKSKKKTTPPPKVEEISEDELELLRKELKDSNLSDAHKEFIEHCIENALWFPHILQKQNISLSKLRKMLFGEAYVKPAPVQNPDAEGDNDNNPPDANATDDENAIAKSGETDGSSDTEASGSSNGDVATGDASTPKARGHGRIPHTAYENYDLVELTIDDFKVGDACPKICGGKLYSFNPNKPRVLVRIQGQNFAKVTKYVVEQLRCNFCYHVVQATIPDEVGKDKYNASFKSWLVLQKYYVAVPFYRQEVFQNLLQFPLPDATQWELVEQAASPCYRVFAHLTMLAANGELLHNDDTKVRIQEVIKEIKANPDTVRRGMYTTGMIAMSGEHKIALFFNGPQHSGENMKDVLAHRDEAKPPIIQMCDALSANIPKDIKTILCNCLSHGFRKFSELVDYFPKECITIMKLLSEVYEHDEHTKTLSKNARLTYHQTKSQPIMDMLWRYMDELFTQKQVEPNSALGNAIAYMQKHWEELTQFLRVPGAPLCNNIVERALKIAIRNRKSAMFYRTCYSAHIGGMLTSLIYTCQLAEANPHTYLTALQEHAEQVQAHPERWLPWNYQEALQAEAKAPEPPGTLASADESPPALANEADASPPVAQPSEGDLVAT